MNGGFKAVRITDRVYWVGAIDWAARDFHGYLTGNGTTYNAYLVLADRITLVDTVKAPFRGELLSRIASVIDPASIDIVISNHAEMDHSGCLTDIIEALKPEKVFASRMGVKALENHFHSGLDIVEVKDGGEIDLGNMKITCYETRMLHWPDSMFSYLADERILFSQDAFGMHLASSERFDDEIDARLLDHEAARYYANILLPFSRFVLKLFTRLEGLGLDIDYLAPDHGPVWRKNTGRILDLYRKWANREIANKAVVVYDTMWGSTDMMARAIGDGLASGGTGASVMKLRSAHRSDIAAEILDAGALIVGSPTINGNMFPTIADALTYIRGLKPTGLIGAVFGSYGWSGEAVKQIEEMLEGMKVELAAGTISVNYVPDETALERCRRLGEAISLKLKDLPDPAPGRIEA